MASSSNAWDMTLIEAQVSAEKIGLELLENIGFPITKLNQPIKKSSASGASGASSASTSSATISTLLTQTFPCGYILSSDNRPIDGHLSFKMQDKLGINGKAGRVYYKDEWHELFIWFQSNISIKMTANSEERQIWNIIKSMCLSLDLGPKYYSIFYNNFRTLKNLSKSYLKFRNIYSNKYPNFIFQIATPSGNFNQYTGEPLTVLDNNIVSYLSKYQIFPNIDGENLLHLFSDEANMGISTFTLRNFLRSLTRKDRYEISIDLRAWLVKNPGILKTPKKWTIPNSYNYSIKICKNCHTMYSQSNFRKFLASADHNMVLAERLGNGKPNLSQLQNKPNTDYMDDKKKYEFAKDYLYIICKCCGNTKISMESLITKFSQNNIDTQYVIDITLKLLEKTIEKQFPNISCVICLEEDLHPSNTYKTKDCTHKACMCFDCRNIIYLQGLPEKGKLIQNCNYQCPCCFKFEITGYELLDKFLENGGVHSGYSGRFCTRCMDPFEEKESCGGESVELSLYCHPCSDMIMKNNLSMRQFVICPKIECGIAIAREDNTCDLMECRICRTQFCYGCNFIFRYDAEVDWTCSCMLLPRTDPREYKDPSLSTCSEIFKLREAERIERRERSVMIARNGIDTDIGIDDRLSHNSSPTMPELVRSVSDDRVRDRDRDRDLEEGVAAENWRRNIRDMSDFQEQLRLSIELGDDPDTFIDNVHALIVRTIE